jgi:hypothetical protein
MLIRDRKNRIKDRAVKDRKDTCDSPDPDGTPQESGQPAASPQSVLINHGIHSGHFPVVGMTVAQARETLGPIINIDPEAVAVIRGQPINNERNRVITSADHMLSFVKKSSVKGAAGRKELEV